MEITTLKKFGKEVGLTFGDMKGLAEDELIKLIGNKVNPDQGYTQEFVDWYQSLDESLFDKEAETSAEGENGGEEINLDELIEMIENVDSEEELKEIYKGFPNIFKDQKTLDKIDDAEKLQETMREIVIKLASGEGGEEGNGEDVSKEDLAEAINGCDDLKELKEILKDYNSFFPNVTAKGLIKLEKLKERMLEALGAGEEEENGLEKMAEAWEAMELPELKATAKEMGIKIKLADKKDDIIMKMAEAYEASGGGEEKAEEPAINQTLINNMVQTKDQNGLNKIAEDLGISLNVFERKSPKKTGDKIIAHITATPPVEKETKKTVSKKEEKKSLFMIIADMVKAGKKDEEIIEAGIATLKEFGKDKIWAQGKVKGMIEIAKLENK